MAEPFPHKTADQRSRPTALRTAFFLSANKTFQFPVDNIRCILLSKLKTRLLFFQSLPQLFHIAIPRKPALDKASGLHLSPQILDPVLLRTDYSELELHASGKVRDVYCLDGNHLLFVATDRISAF